LGTDLAGQPVGAETTENLTSENADGKDFWDTPPYVYFPRLISSMTCGT
jgi:hypothetical protein